MICDKRQLNFWSYLIPSFTRYPCKSRKSQFVIKIEKFLLALWKNAHWTALSHSRTPGPQNKVLKRCKSQVWPYWLPQLCKERLSPFLRVANVQERVDKVSVRGLVERQTTQLPLCNCWMCSLIITIMTMYWEKHLYIIPIPFHSYS